MDKIYIIFDLSHSIDDYGYDPRIDSIFDNLDEASNRMKIHFEDCQKYMADDCGWANVYELWEYPIPFISPQDEGCTLHSRCQNYENYKSNEY